MNYKRMSLRAMMLALVTVLFAGFISCSKSSDDDNNSKVDASAPIGAILAFYYTATEDELSICNITAEYTEENGKKQTETITTTDWEKQLNFKSFSAKGTISVKRTLKANVELTKDSYKLSYKRLGYSTSILYSDKKCLEESYNGGRNDKYKKEEVENYIKDNEIVGSYTYTLDKNKNSDEHYFTVEEIKNKL